MNDKLKKLTNNINNVLKDEFNKVDNICMSNSLKVINAFRKYKVSEVHLHGTTGYGYNDVGREVIENIYKTVLDSEDALVRTQFISGSHALTVCLFALLRPGDTLLSITGLPYDTLHEVIGIKDNDSSLKSFNIKYEQIDLINNDFDYNKIEEKIKSEKIKVIEIQRSRGYSNRESIDIDKLDKVIKFIKNINKDIIIMVDNCYCEFVEDKTPTSIGADIMVGSLIKNLGGGIASNGAYIAGKSKLIDLCAERLTLPGEGREVGPSFDSNKLILQGLYFAPSVVASSMKISILTSYLLEQLGYKVSPKYNDKHADIVCAIQFDDEDKLIKYVQGIQEFSAIDSHVLPLPYDMPGYDDKIIMASGSFTQGSSIEISCDAPIRKPYIAYQQGSLTYEYGYLAVINAINSIMEE